MPTPESLVLKSLCQYLALKERQGKCWFNRQNNGGTYDAKRGTYRTTVGIGYKLGAPDIIACIGGKYVGIEAKAPKGRMSEHQEAFKTGLESSGGSYVIARSIDDLKALFSE